MLVEKLFAERLLPLVDVHVDEAPSERREPDVGLLEFRKFQKLQRFAEREQVVDFVAQRIGKMRQIGLAVVGRSRDLFEHAGERVGRNLRQSERKAVRPAGLARRVFRRVWPLGHQRIDAVDQARETPGRAGRGGGES